MTIWFVSTWTVTVFLTVAAASMYWSVDKTPWRGFLTALSMALAGVAMLGLYRAFASHIDVERLAKILYAACMAQALAQYVVAARVRKRRRSVAKCA